MAETRSISTEELNLLRKQMKVVKIINNALYFGDDSEYQTALWQAMSVMTGIDYSGEEELTFLEEH